MRHTGILRHLLVRKAVKTGEILVALVAASGTVSADKHSSDASVPEVGTEQNDAEKNSAVRLCGQQDQANGDKVQTENSGLTEEMLREWADGLRALTLTGSFAGILHIVNDNFADAVKCDRMEILYGQDCFMEELLGLRFRVSTFSFFQTNSLGAEKLYSLVRDYLMQEGVKGTVFDLYSGTGTIAQLLSPAAEQVIGVEIVEEAVEAAKENAALNGLTNCSFIAGDVLKVLDDVTEKPDYIILDPPRDGIHPKALKKILDYGVDSLVYISCKPTSLARDMEAISAAGYRIIRWGMVDMFPYTGNIETVVCLSKGDVKSKKIRVEFSLEDMDTDGFKRGATYNAIRDWIKAKYGYRVTNLNIAQVKQKHGIIERENYNKPKSPDSKQPGCPEEKVKAIEDAMRHFQMI
ncbi:MAG: class I SAM-dependent RNA methyltransferase [Lachnospiraceae bacterium]|nr:class I SAM-dependent RNA methyltransferase [Lachnospiraceae bacterium]